MKFINNILLILVGLIFVWFICFVPLQGNYKVNKVNEEKSIMEITYSSLVPFTSKDTLVKMPTYFYGKIMYNYYEKTNEGIIYRTAIKVDKEIYTYKSIDAYHYVKEFKVGEDSIKLLELYWPEHHIKILPLNDIYDKKQ